MKDPTKYFIITIRETLSGYEFDMPALYKATTKTANQKANKIAKGWRDDSETEIEIVGYNEIPKADFDVLLKYLADLS